MLDPKKPYKGRFTIRAGRSDDVRNGRKNTRVRSWEFDPKPGTTIAKLENIFLGALNSVDAVIARRDEATKSGKFTVDGINNDVLQFALDQAVPMLKRGRNAIAAAKQEAAALREKTKLGGPDITDPWKVGLMLRAVDRFAAMTQEQRNKLTINPDKLDPIEAEALVTAPASLTGISEAHRKLLVDRALQAQHGEAIAELQELDRAIEAAESAVEAARDEVRLESAVFDPHKFNELAAPVEAKTNAPWLKKFREGDAEVIRKIVIPEGQKTGGAYLATPEDIANGVFADDAETYRKLTGRAAGPGQCGAANHGEDAGQPGRPVNRGVRRLAQIAR
jgi:hypothetical protein